MNRLILRCLAVLTIGSLAFDPVSVGAFTLSEFSGRSSSILLSETSVQTLFQQEAIPAYLADAYTRLTMGLQSKADDRIRRLVAKGPPGSTSRPMVHTLHEEAMAG